MRALLLLALFGAFLVANANGADSNRIIALEQDVRNLERIVGNLEREVRELRQQGRSALPLGLERSGVTESSSDTWVNASKWRKVRLGASELEVIEILGRPTSMRAEGDTRVLLYAMEIGASGFLSGSVTLRDREVSEVEMPLLK